MNGRLFTQAMVKFLGGLIVVGALIFLPAGDFHWPQGWLLVGILFAPMFVAGLVMMKRCPELLEKRLNARERESDQKLVVLSSGIMFVLAFVMAGLNHRFGWISLPGWVSPIAAAVFLLGYALYAEVLRENAYLSRTIEVQKNQKVIDTGLYAIVRHPMYMATLIMFLAMPLVLGSVISFAITLIYVPIIVSRIRGEEKVLEAGLAGYIAYKARVKYRLIPFIW